MWIPDFQLANDVTPFDQGFPKKTKAVIDFSGGTNVVLTGQITFSCNFVMTDFPYDTQTCDAVFSSRAYYSDSLKFILDSTVLSFETDSEDASQVLKKSDGLIWMDSFTHPGNHAYLV